MHSCVESSGVGIAQKSVFDPIEVSRNSVQPVAAIGNDDDDVSSDPGPTATSSGPVIELVDVVATLGQFPALSGATMRVDAGEIVLLRGPNGAGKTTLLRLCAGLLPVVRGNATVMGHDLATDREGVRPHVGLLGHQNGLFADLTVAENVRFWGATVGASTEEIGAAMERMGVADRLADVPVRKLSAGQKRRTALAGLVARRARLWLLDEPHSGLDQRGRDDLDATLRQAAAAGATILVASHELDRAESLATRIVGVVAGQVTAGGTRLLRGASPGCSRRRICASSVAAACSRIRCCRSQA